MSNEKSRKENRSKKPYRKKSKTNHRPQTSKDVEGDNYKTEMVNAPQMSNDPDWYFTDATMKEGLTRLPSMEFLGQNIKLDNAIVFSDDADGDQTVQTVLKSPTLGAHYLNPSPGYSKGPTSAVNMAAKKIYSKMASSNAKTANYAPQDVATLLLSLGEVISIVTYLTRAYGVANYYNKMNRKIPKVFLEAMNYSGSVASWSKEMPAFRNRLNRVITIANAISFPGNIPYFKKCAYVYQHIYADKVVSMSPFHMFIPYSTWIIDETSYEQGSVLKTVDIHLKNPFEVLTILEEMIDAILSSVTYNYIYADVLNLASRGVLGGELLSFATIPIDFTIDPLYSPQFNWQLRNATIYGAPNSSEYIEGQDTPLNDVYPDANANTIVYMPSWSYLNANEPSMVQISEPIIRVPEVAVSEDDLIELLVYAGNKWANLSPASNTAQWNIYCSIKDTDIPDHYLVESRVYAGEDYISSFSGPNKRANDSVIGIVSEFDNFPLIYGIVTNPITLTSGRKVDKVVSIIGELGAYTRNMSKAITNIRYASYLSLFDFK